MMLNKRPRRKFKAITFTKIEKKKFKVDYKEESFKDLDKRIHYPISSAYRGLATWEVNQISVDMLKKKDLTKNLINIEVNNRK